MTSTMLHLAASGRQIFPHRSRLAAKKEQIGQVGIVQIGAAPIGTSEQKTPESESLGIQAVDRKGTLWKFGFPRGKNPKLSAVRQIGNSADWKYYPSDFSERRAAQFTAGMSGLVKGVIVQFGGQTPLNLARGLKEAGVPIPRNHRRIPRCRRRSRAVSRVAAKAGAQATGEWDRAVGG